MKVIAYTIYWTGNEAKDHCIDCTRERYQSHGFTDRLDKQWHSYYYDGVYVDVYDDEGNLVHPIFSTNKWQKLNKSYLVENPIQYLVCI